MAVSRMDARDRVLEALLATPQPITMTALARMHRIGLSTVSRGLGRLLAEGRVENEVVAHETPKGVREYRRWTLLPEPKAEEPEEEPQAERGYGCLGCDVRPRHLDTALCRGCHERKAVQAAKRRLDELQGVRDRMGDVDKEVRQQLNTLIRYWERKAGKRSKGDDLEWTL